MRLTSCFAVVVLAAASLLSVPACRHRDARSAADAMARLQSPDPDEREDAADDLRSRGGPPAVAVPYLIAAAQRENDIKALRAELLALGGSGAPEARPIIEQHFQNPEEAVRKTAIKAMQIWLERAPYFASRNRLVYAPFAARPMPTAPGAAPQSPASDGCEELAQICGTDPFDVPKCHHDLAGLPRPGLQAWADCINTLSTEPCQQAHEKCLAKGKGGGRKK